MSKPDLWTRACAFDVMVERGATTADIGRAMRNLCKAVAAGKPIPKDKFGLWEFAFLEEPGEDH